MSLRLLFCLLATALLTACAGTGSVSDSESARKQSEINTSLGQEYLRRGQLEIALEKLKKAVNFDPEYVPAHTMLAVLYEQIGEADMAEEHYRIAVDLAPSNGDANNNYGAYLCKTGRSDSAIRYFETATKDPFYRTPAVAYANAGSCELQSGNLDKAERFLRESLDYDAEFSDALLALANVSYRKGEFFRARAFLQRYESSGPGSAGSLLLGSRIESRLNNSEGASKYAAELFSRFPNSKQAEELKGNVQ